ncbi:MAG: AAA family ATPase [Trichlorobacter sp.]
MHDYSIKELFQLPVNEQLTVPGRLPTNNPHIPALDQQYRFRRDLLSDLLCWHKTAVGEGLFLTGPTGSGKSSVVLQTAARLQIPVMSITGHSRLESPELVGQYVLKDGQMSYVYGPLAQAMLHGYWFLFDEIDLVDPGTAAGLNSVLEGRPLVIPECGGELIPPHPDFRFIATANTTGGGDRTGLYQGALRMNGAFVDRFWMVEVGYPEAVHEQELLAAAVPRLPQGVIERMLEFATLVRGRFHEGTLDVTFSTRTLLRWGRMMDLFRSASTEGKNPILHALDRALALRAEPDSRIALHELAQRVFGF